MGVFVVARPNPLASLSASIWSAALTDAVVFVESAPLPKNAKPGSALIYLLSARRIVWVERAVQMAAVVAVLRDV